MKYYDKKQNIIKILIELESYLVSYLVLHPKEIIKVSTRIDEDHFTQNKYRQAYLAVLESQIKNRDLTATILEKGLSMHKLINRDFEYREIDKIVDEIIRLSKINKFLDLVQTEVETTTPETEIETSISLLQNELVKINRDKGKRKSDIEHLIKDYEAYQELYKNSDSLLGIPSGFNKIDEVIDGVRPGHFWIIGGYTSTGKTYFSLNMLERMIKEKKRILYYSLEMSENDIISRILGIMAKEQPIKILKGKSEVSEQIKTLSRSRLEIITDITEISKLKMSMIEENMKEPVDAIFIDYIQLIQSKKTDNEYDAMRNVAHELQDISKQIGIPVIALSQLSNEAAKTPDSRVMGFKGAGNIAAAADLALELNPGEENYEEFRRKMNAGESVIVKCYIKKNRHGRVGSFNTLFNARTGIFEETEEITPRQKVYDIKRDVKRVKEKLKEVEDQDMQELFNNL